MSRYSRRRQRAKSGSLRELLAENPNAFLRQWKELEGQWLKMARDTVVDLSGKRAFTLVDCAAAILSVLPVTKETQRARATVNLLEGETIKTFAGDLKRCWFA